MWSWQKVTGLVGGAVAGFWLGGPIGAVAGAVGGDWLGNKLEPKIAQLLTLTATEQNVSVPKGQLLGIAAPQGATIVAVSPAMNSHIGRIHRESAQVWTVEVPISGDVNVTWKDEMNSPLATVVHITAV